MTYKNTIVGFILTIAIGVAAWLTLCYRPLTQPTTSTALLPDAFMEDVSTLIMDKEGKPSVKIVTPKMIHYAENDTTHLTSPQVTLYRKSPQPWYITSKFGKAVQGITQVDFWQDVSIHHAADQDNPDTLIRTPTLTVYPEKQVAETKDFITLTQPNIVIKAVGMYTDMDIGSVKLLSQARGEYVPNS